MINGLSDRLKQLRSQVGLSQKQVAAKLSVSPSIISGYETGERTPSVENLLALSYLYKCSTDYLLGREAWNSCAVLDGEGLTTRQMRLLAGLVEELRA